MDNKIEIENKSKFSQWDCTDILFLDESIRFVGMCSKEGKLISLKYREGITPLLSDRELLYSIIKSVERNTSRKNSEEKLGPVMYSVTSYGNVKRATISLGESLIFVSFEGKGDEFTILKKIMHYAEINHIVN